MKQAKDSEKIDVLKVNKNDNLVELRKMAKEMNVDLDWDYIINSKTQYKKNRKIAQFNTALNSIAFTEGTIYNTNNVISLIGDGYYAEVTNTQAREILNRRIEYLNQRKDKTKEIIDDLNIRQKLIFDQNGSFEKTLSSITNNRPTKSTFGEVLQSGKNGIENDEEKGIEDYYTIGKDGKMYNEEGLEIVDIQEPYLSEEEEFKKKEKRSKSKMNKTTIIQKPLSKDEQLLLKQLDKYEKIESKKSQKTSNKSVNYKNDIELDDDNNLILSNNITDYDSEVDDEDDEDDYYASDDSDTIDIANSIKHTKKDKIEEIHEHKVEIEYIENNYPEYSDDEEDINEYNYSSDEYSDEEEDKTEIIPDSDDDDEYINKKGKSVNIIEKQKTSLITEIESPKSKKEIPKQNNDINNINNKVKFNENVIDLETKKIEKLNTENTKSSRLINPVVIERDTVTKNPVNNIVVEKSYDNEYDELLDLVDSESDNDNDNYNFGEQISSMYFRKQEGLINKGMISRPDERYQDILLSVDEGFEKEKELKLKELESIYNKVNESNHSFSVSVLPDSEEIGPDNVKIPTISKDTKKSQPITSFVSESGILSSQNTLANDGMITYEDDPTIPDVAVKVPLVDAKGKPMSRFKSARMNR